MGRHPEGWKLRPPRPPRRTISVRFSHNGVDYERSTGTADREQAAREAARIYAEIVSREPVKRRLRRYSDSVPLEELVGKWLASAPLDPKTRGTYELYAGTHWIPFFESLVNVNEASCAEYIRERLKRVRASTVRHELTALRGFLRWCREVGALQRDVVVPSVPKKASGTPYEHRRRSRAIELAPDEVRRIIAKLPEWSSSRKVARFPIRGRFEFAYETGLRPDTIDALSVPRHWDRRSKVLRVTIDVDKNAWEREVPLSPRALAVLKRVAPKEGLIFGKHDYRDHLAAAAKAVLGPHRGKLFAGAHLRSACATHLLEETGNLPGVQHLLGHRKADTTALYVRPSFRAAAAALQRRR